MIVIDAPHFYAAVVFGFGFGFGRVVRAAPIVKYMLGWERQRVIDYAARKHWRTLVLR